MSKRVIEPSSSSPFGSGDNATDGGSQSSNSGFPSEGNIVKSSQSHLQNEKGSPKKAKNDSTVSEQIIPNGVRIILKRELPETINVACSNSTVGQPLHPELKLSNGEPVLSMVHPISKEREQPFPPKKTSCPKPHEKYFEGCLVMGSIARGCPFWPGMIRKAGHANFRDRGYTKFSGDKIMFCVQFFQDPSTMRWMTPGTMRIFDAAKPNQCNHGLSTVVKEFEKGIKIAKAAANVSVQTRLAKFSLFPGQSIDDLLAAIDNVNFQHNTNASTPIQPPTLRNDLHVQEKVFTAPSTQENGGSKTDLVTQNDYGSAYPSDVNEEICHDSVENYKKRISEFRQKLQEKCNREKDEEIKILATEKCKLEKENHELKTIVQKQVKVIVELHEILEKEKLEHKNEVEKEKQVKLKYKEESEKLKAVLEEMLLG